MIECKKKIETGSCGEKREMSSCGKTETSRIKGLHGLHSFTLNV